MPDDEMKQFAFAWPYRKGELRTIEGNAVVQDMREPAKLGISFSYGEYWTHVTTSARMLTLQMAFDQHTHIHTHTPG